MHLSHVKVTSYAITGSVCTKSCSSWVYTVGTVEVNQNKQTATELFVIQPEAGARSPQRALKAIRREGNLRSFEKIMLDKYVQRISAHTNA